MKPSNHSRYMVKSLVHASRVLEAFVTPGDVLRLRDVVERTNFNKGMCFRLLYTLHQCGFLDKVGENHYRLAAEVRRRRLYRLGYGFTRLERRSAYEDAFDNGKQIAGMLLEGLTRQRKAV